MKNIYLAAMVLSLLAISCSSAKKKEYNDVVDGAMDARQEAVQKCFKSAQAQGRPGEPNSSGDVELSVNASPAGKVTHVSVIRSTMNSKILEDCVAEVVRRSDFGKSDDGRVKQFTRVFHFGTQVAPSP